jgi:hypothetical protein
MPGLEGGQRSEDLRIIFAAEDRYTSTANAVVASMDQIAAKAATVERSSAAMGQGLQQGLQQGGAGAAGLQRGLAGVSGQAQAAGAAATGMGSAVRGAAGQATPAVQGLGSALQGTGLQLQLFTRGMNLLATGGAVGMAAASVVALTDKVLDLGMAGSSLINIERSYQRLTDSMGINSAEMLAHMTELSSGIVTQAELMRTYNVGVGLAGEAVAKRFGEYIQLARAAAAQTGQSFEYMLNSAIVATGRLSVPIADNLTITVDAEAAYERYAASIGKSASELSKLEKQEAFAIEMMEQAKVKFGDLNEATANLAGDGIARLKTSFEELGNAAATAAAPGIDRLADSVAALAGLLDGPVGLFLKLYQAQQDFVTSGEGAAGTFRTLANAIGLFGPATTIVLGAQVGLERVTVSLTEKFLDQVRVLSLAGNPIAQYVAGLIGLKGAFADTSDMSATAALNLMRAAEAEAALASGARGAQGSLKGLNSVIGSAIALANDLAGAAANAGERLAGMATDMRVSVMRAMSYAQGLTQPQLKWFTTGKQAWELPEAIAEYGRALGSWFEGQGRQVWTEHNQAISAGASGYDDLQSAMESYYESWRSQAQGILSPTQDFDLGALTEEVYGYQDKWDEPARRAMDVVKLGAESPWAAQMGLGGKEQALQYVKDFYAGLLPEEVNWEAAIGQYQAQMEGLLGQQNLGAMFEEKLIGAGWGPDNAAVALALEAPFAPAGTDSAAAFAGAFTGYDWGVMGTDTGELILTGLRQRMERGDARLTSVIESLVISTVRNYISAGGALP